MTAVLGRTTDPYLDIAEGIYPDRRIVNVAGTNPLVGTVTEEVWDVGGTLVYPTAEESWELVSADANDTAAGTGAREVTIGYLDGDYVEQQAVVATNGGTVATGITDGFRLLKARVTAVGSGAENAGNITIQATGGGNPRGQINAGDTSNESQHGHYTIPAGKTGYLVFFYEEINKNEDVRFNVRRTDGPNGIFRTLITSSLYQDQFGSPLKAPADPLPEKTDVKIECVSSNSVATATIYYQLVLVDN